MGFEPHLKRVQKRSGISLSTFVLKTNLESSSQSPPLKVSENDETLHRASSGTTAYSSSSSTGNNNIVLGPKMYHSGSSRLSFFRPQLGFLLPSHKLAFGSPFFTPPSSSSRRHSAIEMLLMPPTHTHMCLEGGPAVCVCVQGLLLGNSSNNYTYGDSSRIFELKATPPKT